MSFIVTGAAGFIGANIVKGLNNRGCNDVIAVDNLTQADKFVNLADHHIIDYFDKVDFIEKVKARKIAKPEAIFHEGACSDTMEHNGHYMMENTVIRSSFSAGARKKRSPSSMLPPPQPTAHPMSLKKTSVTKNP